MEVYTFPNILETLHQSSKSDNDHQSVDEQEIPDGQVATPTSVEQPSNKGEDRPSKPRQEARLCSFFQQRHCQFGAKCFNIHEMPASSDKLPEPSEEPTPQVPTSASI